MSALVRCVECLRFSMKGAPAMAVHGFGNCNLRPAWEYQSATYAKECRHYERAGEETIAARVEWINDKRSNAR